MRGLRARWQFALFGLIGFVILSLALAIGRACGFFTFELERIPGELLIALFSRPTALLRSTETFDRSCYFVLGALLGLAYRETFAASRYRWRVDWRFCAVIGILQWSAFGIVIALREPRLARGIPLLPASPIMHSVTGLLTGIFILVLNCFFVIFVGSLAHLPRAKPRQEPEILEMPRQKPRAA